MRREIHSRTKWWELPLKCHLYERRSQSSDFKWGEAPEEIRRETLVVSDFYGTARSFGGNRRDQSVGRCRPDDSATAKTDGHFHVERCKIDKPVVA